MDRPYVESWRPHAEPRSVMNVNRHGDAFLTSNCSDFAIDVAPLDGRALFKLALASRKANLDLDDSGLSIGRNRHDCQPAGVLFLLALLYLSPMHEELAVVRRIVISRRLGVCIRRNERI